ncbi:cation transporter [Desulfovibrio ferrophilus]|uniref:Cation transporter n=2 Tax=Desulfovibrio ferrophilus TaxID=241368 RepID=A0A2Z6AWU6_9BACT|nr:cation transporter [Desulfovibrio ferrophilus]
MLIMGFALTIVVGTALLLLDACRAGGELSLVDALFTATSAVCVTGLAVVDTGSFFSSTGHVVLLGLIQLGGLGIMTYSSMVFLLWRQRVSLSDRLAVRQTLLHDPSFNMATFLRQVVLACLLLELLGAACLYLFDSESFPPFSALFHAVSAFCNAGFSLQGDSLVAWKDHAGINLTFMALIILGGLGFAVLLELAERIGRIRLRDRASLPARLSWHSRIVLTTSFMLIAGGALAIYLAEFSLHQGQFSHAEEFLASVFQSVTCRTAGFNTMNIGGLTNISLLVMMGLMFVGGSPGSCAGGVKTTTFRALLAFCLARLRGRRQSVVARRFALDEASMNDALTLIMFGMVIIGVAALVLSITEVGAVPHNQTRGLFLELLFECVSAFATVGLSTGVTPNLTVTGKLVITVLMFIGRLGPIVFISLLHDLQRTERFMWPEKRLPMG